jgi:hypothetical protein
MEDFIKGHGILFLVLATGAGVYAVALKLSLRDKWRFLNKWERIKSQVCLWILQTTAIIAGLLTLWAMALARHWI